MLVNFSNRETWTVLNQKLEEALGIDSPRSSIKIYQGLHHALMEVVMGLARQFPFKKNIFYWKGIDPYLEPVAMALAREGYKVTALNVDQIQNPDAWLAEVNKETLMILFPEDDPLLGKLHPILNLQEKLKDSKAFTLKLSHHAYHYREWPRSLEKFQIEVYAVGNQLTLALLGERARFGDWISEGLTWNGNEVEQISALRPARKLNPEKILNFERQLPKSFLPLFSDQDRLFDRSVFYSEEIDGSAIIESLALLQGSPLLPPGEETRFETTSLSRWGGLRTMDWLKPFGLTPKQIRGLVILNEKVIEPDLNSKLERVKTDLLRRQGF